MLETTKIGLRAKKPPVWSPRPTSPHDPSHRLSNDPLRESAKRIASPKTGEIMQAICESPPKFAINLRFSAQLPEQGGHVPLGILHSMRIFLLGNTYRLSVCR